MKILTAILDPRDQSNTIHDLYSIIPCTWNNVKDFFEHSILVANERKEDVIFFAKNPSFLEQLDLKKLEEIIMDLACERINFLYNDVERDEREELTVVNDSISIVGNLSAANSFFIFRPLFNFILTLIKNSEEEVFENLVEVTNIISKHNFKLSFNPSKCFQHNIRIISPFRNAKPYLKDNVESILKQNYKQFDVYYIDDFSDDESSASIPENRHIHQIRNSYRKYALPNIVELLLKEKFDDEDIVCLVDADDLLPHKYVLDILNNAYNIKNLNFVYGAMTHMNKFQKSGYGYTSEEFIKIRNSIWKLSHIRSFKYKLFKELLNQDPDLKCLKDKNGLMFKMPYDMALFFPLIEIGGPKNVKFLNTPLYVYRTHDNNDHIKNRKIQYISELEIREKEPLKKAF